MILLFILPVNLALFKILLFCKNLGAFGLSDFSSASYTTTHPSLGTYSGHHLFTYCISFQSPSRICPGASLVQSSYS